MGTDAPKSGGLQIAENEGGGIRFQQSVNVAVASSEDEDLWGIRKADWKRIRRNMSRVRKPYPTFSNTFHQVVGAAISTLVTMVTTFAGATVSPWLAVLLPLLFVGLSAFAFALWKMEGALIAHKKDDEDAMSVDLEEIESRFKPLPKEPGSEQVPAK